MQRRLFGQQHLAVTVGEERVAVMEGVAHPVLVVVEPAEEREQAQEDPIEAVGAEDGAVDELVAGEAGDEGRDGTQQPE